MSSIKTVVLDGTEKCVSGLSGQNTVIINLGNSAVYAGTSPGIVPGADGIAEIPSGGGIVLYDTHGTVYLSGSGKVQLTGTDYSTVNFKMPPLSNGGGGVVVGDEISLAGIVSDDSLCFYEEESV